MCEQGDKEQKDLIMSLHHAKTDKFMELISNGTLQLRPGVKNLIGAAQHELPVHIWPARTSCCFGLSAQAAALA